jgi:predicted aspartyl protease
MVSIKCGFDDGPAGNGHELLTQLGPTLLVDIGFDPSYDPSKGGKPASGIQGVHALVDTGATECCIDTILASTLNLPIVDRRVVSGSSGGHLVNVYLAQVYVHYIDKTMFGAFAGVNLRAGGQVHGALIGRTFLRHFTMTYEGRTGTVVISDD